MTCHSAPEWAAARGVRRGTGSDNGAAADEDAEIKAYSSHAIMQSPFDCSETNTA